MRSAARRRFLRWILIALVCLLALGGLGRLAGPSLRHWQTERAIARFERAPSQTGADTLVRLIDEKVPTAEQGARILELLLQPRIVTQPSHPLGSSPTFELDRPFAVPFRNVSLARDEQIWCDGELLRSSTGSAMDVVAGLPVIRSLYPAPQNIGTYHIKSQVRYALNLHHRERTWSWRPLSGPFPRCLLPRRDSIVMPFRSLKQWDYTCTVVATADVVVVDKSQSEASPRPPAQAVYYRATRTKQ